MNETFLKAIFVMTRIANAAACSYAYSAGYGDEVNERFEMIHANEDCGESFWREVFALPYEEKLALGFRKFAEGDTKMCIPIWIWECLPDDMLIEGKKKKDLDNDIRFGCVYWQA